MKGWKTPFVVMALFAGGCRDSGTNLSDRVVIGNAERGRVLVTAVGCNACHDIPSVRGPRGVVGPPLDGIRSRPFLGGAIPNRPATMAAFVRDAPSLVPNTAMPRMPLDQQAAEDVTAFLYSLP